MRRVWVWWALGLVAIAALSGGAYVLIDWKKRAQLTAGTDTFASLMALLNSTESQFGIPHDLLARQAYQESHFRADIINGSTVSSAGAQGLMQLVPVYYPGVDPLDPVAAAQAAAKSLVAYHQRFGSWALALAAYNAGPGNVHKYGGIPPFPETQKYVANILGDVPTAQAA